MKAANECDDSRLTVIRPVEVHTTQGAPHLTCQPLEQTVLNWPLCKFAMMTQSVQQDVIIIVLTIGIMIIRITNHSHHHHDQSAASPIITNHSHPHLFELSPIPFTCPCENDVGREAILNGALRPGQHGFLSQNRSCRCFEIQTSKKHTQIFTYNHVLYIYIYIYYTLTYHFISLSFLAFLVRVYGAFLVVLHGSEIPRRSPRCTKFSCGISIFVVVIGA